MTAKTVRGYVTSRHPTRRHFQALILCTLLTVLVLSPLAADAHFRQQDGDWFYSGHTHRGGDKSIDPLNIFFHGGGLRQVNPGWMFDNHWAKMDSPNGFENTFGCTSTQNIYDKHPRHDDEVDVQKVTGCFEDRAHARIWDSVEHDQAYPGKHNNQTTDQMGIAGVHHEDCCPDELNISWEHMEKVTRKRLGEFCGWRNDLHLPGSRGKFQKYFSNGRITRISPERRSADGPCGGG